MKAPWGWMQLSRVLAISTGQSVASSVHQGGQGEGYINRLLRDSYVDQLPRDSYIDRLLRSAAQ